MDRKADCQIALAEAKANLRRAASRASLSSWVRENTGEALLTAFIVGMDLGGGRVVRDSGKLASTFMKWFRTFSSCPDFLR